MIHIPVRAFRISCVLLCLIWNIAAQTQVDLRTQSKSVDFSSANVTKPMATGNTLPATCTSGQMYFLLNAPLGANLYACAATNQWSLQSGSVSLGGDVSGSPGSLTVSGIQGRPVSSTAPSAGQALIWNLTTQSWQPQTPPVAGGLTASLLQDFVPSINGAILTIGQYCSAAAPCNTRVGNTIYSISAPATVTLGSGTGSVFLYISSAGALTAGSNLPVSCNAVCTVQPGITAFPTNGIPLFSVSAASGIWNTNGVLDYRAFLSSPNLAAGTGVIIAGAGQSTIVSVDSSVVSLKVAVPVTSSSACAVGAWATDGSFFYLCTAANLWKRTSLASW